MYLIEFKLMIFSCSIKARLVEFRVFSFYNFSYLDSSSFDFFLFSLHQILIFKELNIERSTLI
jgi:hypothetical protein